MAPQETELVASEPALCVVTDPMKSVTKLGRATNPPPAAVPPPTGGGSLSDMDVTLKRKYQATLDVHSQMIQTMTDTQQMIMRELQR